MPNIGPYQADWVYPGGNPSDTGTHHENQPDGSESPDKWIADDWETQTVYITKDGEQDEEPYTNAYVEVERVLWVQYALEGSEKTAIYEYGQIWGATVNSPET